MANGPYFQNQFSQVGRKGHLNITLQNPRPVIPRLNGSGRNGPSSIVSSASGAPFISGPACGGLNCLEWRQVSQALLDGALGP